MNVSWESWTPWASLPEVGTVCLVCREGSEETHACEVCGGALHAQCIADHFAGVEVSETNPCVFVCHACVILRLIK